MQWSDLLSVLGDGNTNTVHFMSTVSHVSDFLIPFSAMANMKGGMIIVGLDIKNCHLVGSQLDESWFKESISSFSSKGVSFELKTIVRDFKIIQCVMIPECHFKPIFFHDVCYVMEEGVCRVATSSEQREMEFEREDVFNEDKKDQFSHDLTVITDELLELQSSDDLVSEGVNFITDATKQSNFNGRQLQALQYLQTHNEIANKYYRQMFDVSHKTAHIELTALMDERLVSKVGNGRSTKYVLNRI